jgi:hypothetical protein
MALKAAVSSTTVNLSAEPQPSWSLWDAGTKSPGLPPFVEGDHMDAQLL